MVRESKEKKTVFLHNVGKLTLKTCPRMKIYRLLHIYIHVRINACFSCKDLRNDNILLALAPYNEYRSSEQQSSRSAVSNHTKPTVFRLTYPGHA